MKPEAKGTAVWGPDDGAATSAHLAQRERLAQRLLAAVRAQRFEDTADSMEGGRPVAHFPSIDLAVIAFPPGRPPLWANVLFSREFPRGIVADIAPDAGAVRNVRFESDRLDAQGRSAAWLPAAQGGLDWSTASFAPLAGAGPQRFVAPYPASLVKLMVALGVALAAGVGCCGWEDAWLHGGRARAVAAWCEDMIVLSCNDSTEAMVALLHRAGWLGARNRLHEAFAAWGLHTLRLDRTTAAGGWRNADGAGVGALQMTAWDSARLLWLLDADAPPPPWLRGAAPAAAGARVRGWLEEQALHEILSSTALAGITGHVHGLPARLPARWIAGDGAVQAGDRRYPADVRPVNDAATLRFAHKTGTTDNYASDAGIVTGLGNGAGVPLGTGDGASLGTGAGDAVKIHAIVAVLTSLGRRYASDPRCATTWRLPALGRAVHEALVPLFAGPA